MMRYCIVFLAMIMVFTSCNNELTFEDQTFLKTTTIACEATCPEASVTIPFANNVPIVADSINKKVFSVTREIIYFGEKPYVSNDYDDLLASFIGSYEEMHKKFPKDTFGWEARIKGTVKYQSDAILNIAIDHYTFTGGAHGYQGLRSLLFDAKTGKFIANNKLFNDEKAFKKFAEKQFRIKYKIPENSPINATGLMFEDEVFQLPQNIFYTENGLLLYYNSYEAASYADGPKELLLSYEEVKSYLITQ